MLLDAVDLAADPRRLLTCTHVEPGTTLATDGGIALGAPLRVADPPPVAHLAHVPEGEALEAEPQLAQLDLHRRHDGPREPHGRPPVESIEEVPLDVLDAGGLPQRLVRAEILEHVVGEGAEPQRVELARAVVHRLEAKDALDVVEERRVEEALEGGHREAVLGPRVRDHRGKLGGHVPLARLHRREPHGLEGVVYPRGHVLDPRPEGQPAREQRVPVPGDPAADEVQGALRVEERDHGVDIPRGAPRVILEPQHRADGVGEEGVAGGGLGDLRLVEARHHQVRRPVEEQLEPAEELDHRLSVQPGRVRDGGAGRGPVHQAERVRCRHGACDCRGNALELVQSGPQAAQSNLHVARGFAPALRLEQRVLPVDEQQERAQPPDVLGERGAGVGEQPAPKLLKRAEKRADVLPPLHLPGEIEHAALGARVQGPREVLRPITVQPRDGVMAEALREPAREVRVAHKTRCILGSVSPCEGLQRRNQAQGSRERERGPRGAPGVNTGPAEPTSEQGRHLLIRDPHRQLARVRRRRLSGKRQRQARLVVRRANHVPLIEREVHLGLLPARGHEGAQLVKALCRDRRSKDQHPRRLIEGAERPTEQQVHLEDAYEHHLCPARDPAGLESQEAPLVGIGELQLLHLPAPRVLDLCERLPATQLSGRASRVGLEPRSHRGEVMAPLSKFRVEHSQVLCDAPPGGAVPACGRAREEPKEHLRPSAHERALPRERPGRAVGRRVLKRQQSVCERPRRHDRWREVTRPAPRQRTGPKLPGQPATGASAGDRDHEVTEVLGALRPLDELRSGPLQEGSLVSEELGGGRGSGVFLGRRRHDPPRLPTRPQSFESQSRN